MLLDHQTLYDTLLNLTDVHQSFYYTDCVDNDRTYRIFLYRIASYSEFCLPLALESRGITFLLPLTSDGIPELVCRPMNKFFNLNENPFTIGLDLSEDNIDQMHIKSDGSLMSSYMDTLSQVRLKSKGSLSSIQAIQAQELLAANDPLKMEITDLTNLHGYTVNLEYVAPTNRIVVLYNAPELVVLNMRNRITGDVIHSSQHPILDDFPLVRKHWVNTLREYTNSDQSYVSAIEESPHLQGIEGYVVYLKTGECFKLKCDWYLVLHRTRDTMGSDKALFLATVMETTDDLRSLFHDSPDIQQCITDMHNHVQNILGDMTSKVDSFHNENQHLDRKSYAIKASTLEDKIIFNLAMSKYLQRPIDYKEVLSKYYLQYLPTTQIIVS